jgi:hypothetical protein
MAGVVARHGAAAPGLYLKMRSKLMSEPITLA